MEFKLVSESCKRDFEVQVNRLIKSGWMLKGNHTTVHKSGLIGLIYTQAMVKED